MSIKDISRADAGHALNFFYSDEGMSGGDFTQSLLGTAARADINNRTILENAYPGLIGAFRLISEVRGGNDVVRDIFAREA